jgi:hypothetical protein
MFDNIYFLVNEKSPKELTYGFNLLDVLLEKTEFRNLYNDKGELITGFVIKFVNESKIYYDLKPDTFTFYSYPAHDYMWAMDKLNFSNIIKFVELLEHLTKKNIKFTLVTCIDGKENLIFAKLQAIKLQDKFNQYCLQKSLQN